MEDIPKTKYSKDVEILRKLIFEHKQGDARIEELQKIIVDLKMELYSIISSIKYLEDTFYNERKEYENAVKPNLATKIYNNFISGEKDADVELEFQQALDAQNKYEKEFDEMLKLRDKFDEYSNELKTLQIIKRREEQIKEIEYEYVLELNNEKTDELRSIEKKILHQIKHIRKIRTALAQSKSANRLLGQCIEVLESINNPDNPLRKDTDDVERIIDQMKIHLRIFINELPSIELSESKKIMAEEFKILCSSVFKSLGIIRTTISFSVSDVEDVKSELDFLTKYIQTLEKSNLNKLYTMAQKARDMIDT